MATINSDPKRISELPPFTTALPSDSYIPVVYNGSNYKVRYSDFLQTQNIIIDKVALGLDKVNNTADTDKPLSNAVVQSLAGKANLLHTHEVSDINQFTFHVTDVIKSVMSTIPVTEIPLVNTALSYKADLSILSGYVTTTVFDTLVSSVNNKSDKNHTHTPLSIGLSNVDNTSDLNKPISTATQAALNDKVDKSYLATVIAGLGSGGGAVVKVKQKPHMVARYNTCDQTGYNVSVLASHPLFTSETWTRTGPSLVMELDSSTIDHETISVGDSIIVYNAGERQTSALVTMVNGTSITMDCSDIGAFTNVNTGAINYIVKLKYTHNSVTSGALTSGSLSISNALTFYSTQIISMSFYIPANALAATSYVVNLPASFFNIIGLNDTIDNLYLPSLSVRTATDVLPVLGATLYVNQSGAGYRSFTIGSLGSVAQGKLINLNF